MDIRRLTDLMAADELTLRFTPLGFGLDRKLTPESAAEVHQQTIASADLVDAVPGDVRAAFEDLRNCHAYGVLSYGFFTISANQSYLVLEQALRTRFVQFYDGMLPVQDASGHLIEIPVRNFEEVNEGFRKGGIHAKHGWKLRSELSGHLDRVPLTLASLLEWARRERLLDGQRAKSNEKRQSQFRNWFVHGNQPRRGMPNESARRINDLAETINRLWGARTPGGRLYPAPMSRVVIALAWSSDDDRHCCAQMNPARIPEHVQAEGGHWTFLLTRAVPGDDDLLDFDNRYERTRFPADLVWGPGEGLDAFNWWQANHPEPDTVEHVDRLFLIRVDAGKVYLPRRPPVALALPPEHRHGTWHIIRADFPQDAFVHVRNLREGTCTRGAPGCGCSIADVASGSWPDVEAFLGAPTAPASGQFPVRVPPRFPLPTSVGCD